MIETLTPSEVAKSLKLHPFTVARLAREGKIPAFKVGGVWRIKKDEFERWIISMLPKQHRKVRNSR
jgi:excisionase family DNA binding protein